MLFSIRSLRDRSNAVMPRGTVCFTVAALALLSADALAQDSNDAVLSESRAIVDAFGQQLRTAVQATMAGSGPVAAIDRDYPFDIARGYEAGDARGAFSVVWPKERAVSD